MAVRECDRFGADLSAYVDGELTPARTAEIERHLPTCADCQRRCGELRELAQSLAALPRIAAPPGLATDVRRAISRGDAAPRTTPPRRWWVGLLNARAGGVAAVFALALFTTWLAWPPAAPRWDAQEELRRTFPPAAPPAATPAPPESAAGGDGFVSTLQPERAAPPAARAEPPAQPPVAASPAITVFEPADLRVAAREAVSDSPPVVAEAVSHLRATLGEVSPVAYDAMQADAPAAMEVVIAPRTAAEYDSILQLLGAKLEDKAPTLGLPVFAGGAAAAEPRRDAEQILKKPVGGGGDEWSAATAHNADLPQVFSVRSNSARDLLLALAEAAPGNVDVRLEFGADAVTQVQRMLDSAPEAEAPVAAAAIADRADGGAAADDAKEDQLAAGGAERGGRRERAMASPSTANEQAAGAAGGGAAAKAPRRGEGRSSPEREPATQPASDADSPPVAGRGGARDERKEERGAQSFRTERRVEGAGIEPAARPADREGRPDGEDDAQRVEIDLDAAIEPLRWLAAGATEFAGDVFSVGRAVIQPPAESPTPGGVVVRVVVMPVGAKDARTADLAAQRTNAPAPPAASQPATRGGP